MARTRAQTRAQPQESIEIAEKREKMNKSEKALVIARTRKQLKDQDAAVIADAERKAEKDLELQELEREKQQRSKKEKAAEARRVRLAERLTLQGSEDDKKKEERDLRAARRAERKPEQQKNVKRTPRQKKEEEEEEAKRNKEEEEEAKYNEEEKEEETRHNKEEEEQKRQTLADEMIKNAADQAKKATQQLRENTEKVQELKKKKSSFIAEDLHRLKENVSDLENKIVIIEHTLKNPQALTSEQDAAFKLKLKERNADLQTEERKFAELKREEENLDGDIAVAEFENAQDELKLAQYQDAKKNNDLIGQVEAFEGNQDLSVFEEDDDRYSRDLNDDDLRKEAAQTWGPRVVERTMLLQNSVNELQISGPELCRLLSLKLTPLGSVVAPTQPPPRSGTLKKLASGMYVFHFIDVSSPGKIIDSVPAPTFADMLSLNSPDFESGKMEFATIQTAKRISGTVLYELTLIPRYENDAHPPVDLLASAFEEDDVTEQTVQITPFQLNASPSWCATTASASDVIANFIANDPDSLNFIAFVADIANPKDFGPKDVASLSDDAYAFGEVVTKTVDAMASQIIRVLESSRQKLAVACPGKIVDTQCLPVDDSVATKDGVQQATSSIPGMFPSFVDFAENLISFRDDLDNRLSNPVLAAELCSYFPVPKNVFEALRAEQAQNWSIMRTQHGNCFTDFMIAVHRGVFEAYRQVLGAQWKRANNMTETKSAALMWLLYFTQLPLFSARLTQSILKNTTTKNVTYVITSLVKEFHELLTNNTTGFLPKRLPNNVQQSGVIDSIRLLLRDSQPEVEAYVSRLVKRLPNCPTSRPVQRVR